MPRIEICSICIVLSSTTTIIWVSMLPNSPFVWVHLLPVVPLVVARLFWSSPTGWRLLDLRWLRIWLELVLDSLLTPSSSSIWIWFDPSMWFLGWSTGITVYGTHYCHPSTRTCPIRRSPMLARRHTLMTIFGTGSTGSRFPSRSFTLSGFVMESWLIILLGIHLGVLSGCTRPSRCMPPSWLLFLHHYLVEFWCLHVHPFCRCPTAAAVHTLLDPFSRTHPGTFVQPG